MKYFSKNSLIALIIAIQPSPAITQNAQGPIAEKTAQSRVILTITSESDWDFETNDHNTTITIRNGVIEKQTNQTQPRRPTFNFDISGTKTSPSSIIQLPCSCIISVERYKDGFLIVDLLNINAEQNASISDTAIYNTSDDFHKWWQTSSPESNYINPLTAATANDAIDEHSITKLAEHADLEILHRYNQSRQIESMKTHDPTISQPRIGILTPQMSSNVDQKINHDCPLKSLYQNANRRSSTPLSLELRSTREETLVPNGSLNMNGLLNYSQQLFALGLTQEAVQILGLIDESKFEKQILTKVVKIASGEKGIFFNENELKLCSGLLDLWTLIASSDPPSSHDDGNLAILQFKSLPPHVQLEISEFFLSSLSRSSNKAEIMAFMITQNGGPPPHTLASIDNTADVEHNILLEANRDNPLKIIDLLESPTETNPDQLVALSESLRTQLRRTDSWIDVMNAEITFDIANFKFESAASKINLLISKETSTAIVQSKMHQFIDAFFDQAPPRETLSLQLSGLLDQWPDDIQDALAHHVNELGFSDLIGDTGLAPLQRHIRQGHVVGPNEYHFSPNKSDNLQTNLTAQRVHQTLDQVKNFKQELLLTLQSE